MRAFPDALPIDDALPALIEALRDTTRAVLVAPPAKVRPLIPDKDWFRARGENYAYLFWWGLRHDADPQEQRQGFSE